MSTGEKYLAAAYLVVFAAVLVYLVIIALKVARLERDLAELTELARERGHVVLELLFWPAVLAYGEAAVAYAGNVRYPGLGGSRSGACASAGSSRLPCSSSRPSARTAFPWDTWAGSLNLFVWLVVGGYLVWGCKPRYRLLGLAVMPFAAILLAASYLGGGTDTGGTRDLSTRLPRRARRARAGGLRGADPGCGARRRSTSGRSVR